MKRCQSRWIGVCFLLLAVVPAYCQRGTFGIDAGQTTDKFGALSSVSGFEYGIDGQLMIIRANQKGGPDVLAGGEIRIPSDTANHAKEYAIYGGVLFPIHNLSVGVDAQIRKIILPVATVDNQVFIRDKMELLELPLVIKYSFGTAKRAFIQVQGAPEFTPRFRSAGAPIPLPNPNFDHGYFIQGTAGYSFGKWYAKATYETRYFKFANNPNNPTDLYNWRTNRITAGVGLAF